MTDRLSELESQAASISAEIAKLKAERPAPPPPPPRDEVRILQLNNELTTGMPNLREMERLFSAVKALSPWPSALNDKYDEHRPFRGFSSCFRWLANKGRTEFHNPKFALSFWLDDCKNWLRVRNCVGSDVDANALILAVYAAGDVRYVPAAPSLGTVWELALAEHVGRAAVPDAWRKILTGGAAAILPPSAPARRTPGLSNVRVVVGY